MTPRWKSPSRSRTKTVSVQITSCDPPRYDDDLLHPADAPVVDPQMDDQVHTGRDGRHDEAGPDVLGGRAGNWECARVPDPLTDGPFRGVSTQKRGPK